LEKLNRGLLRGRTESSAMALGGLGYNAPVPLNGEAIAKGALLFGIILLLFTKQPKSAMALVAAFVKET
jgi:hypothetical protein